MGTVLSVIGHFEHGVYTTHILGDDGDALAERREAD